MCCRGQNHLADGHVIVHDALIEIMFCISTLEQIANYFIDQRNQASLSSAGLSSIPFIMRSLREALTSLMSQCHFTDVHGHVCVRCRGQAHLADGRVILAGGTSWGGPVPGLADGLKGVRIFSAANSRGWWDNSKWTNMTRMWGGRW